LEIKEEISHNQIMDNKEETNQVRINKDNKVKKEDKGNKDNNKINLT